MIKLFDLTKESVEQLPNVNILEECDELFNEIVIIPTDDIHECGYRCMQFVFGRNGVYTKRVYRGSDVIHLNGIGGYGEDYLSLTNMVPRVAWRIDCTPNGFLRLFITEPRIKIGSGISDFQIYVVEK